MEEKKYKELYNKLLHEYSKSEGKLLAYRELNGRIDMWKEKSIELLRKNPSGIGEKLIYSILKHVSETIKEIDNK